MKTVPTKIPLTFEVVEQLFKATKKKATPHREPDFKKIRKLGVADDAPVSGTIRFIEEHNTGYEGLLERWEFVTTTKEGEKVRFWADLLPGDVLYQEPLKEDKWTDL